MILGMLIGFAIAVIAGAIGHFQGYLMGTKVKNLKSLIINPEPVATIIQSKTMCGCTHGLHAHKSNGNGACQVLVKPGYGCACQFFVGKEIAAPATPKSHLDLS